MPLISDNQAKAYSYLEEADTAIKSGDTAAGTMLLYAAIEYTMTCLAKQRGLPHATRGDLSAFASKLDAEHTSQHRHFVSFASARALRDNIAHQFSDQEELLLSRPDLGEFLDLLMTYWRQDA